MKRPLQNVELSIFLLVDVHEGKWLIEHWDNDALFANMNQEIQSCFRVQIS
uniref:Uncharacterized protein n=1 Tax=Rhizophora mucronata TaxID=61149 RepID=A0A2P2PNL7_RHIMU